MPAGRRVDERSKIVDLAGGSLAQTLQDAHQGLRVLVQPHLSLRHHHDRVKQDLPVAVDEDTELLVRRLVTDRQTSTLVRLDDVVLEEAKPVDVLRGRDHLAGVGGERSARRLSRRTRRDGLWLLWGG